jgi:hypothetical protein
VYDIHNEVIPMNTLLEDIPERSICYGIMYSEWKQVTEAEESKHQVYLRTIKRQKKAFKIYLPDGAIESLPFHDNSSRTLSEVIEEATEKCNTSTKEQMKKPTDIDNGKLVEENLSLDSLGIYDVAVCDIKKWPLYAVRKYMEEYMERFLENKIEKNQFVIYLPNGQWKKWFSNSTHEKVSRKSWKNSSLLETT